MQWEIMHLWHIPYDPPVIYDHQRFYCLFNRFSKQICKKNQSSNNTDTLRRESLVPSGTLHMGSAMRKRHHWQDDKNALNQILYILNFIAVGYDMVLNTTQGRNAKTLFTLASHKRHPIPHPYGQAMGHPLWELWRKVTARYPECTV